MRPWRLASAAAVLGGVAAASGTEGACGGVAAGGTKGTALLQGACGGVAAGGTKGTALLQVNNAVVRKIHGNFEQEELDFRPRPGPPSCVTRSDERASVIGYYTSPAGTECIFGVDVRDEGSHCIFDDGMYGSFGWCYTSLDRSSWGSCSEGCPLFGASKILGDRIDHMKAEIKRELQEAVPTLPPVSVPPPPENMPVNPSTGIEKMKADIERQMEEAQQTLDPVGVSSPPKFAPAEPPPRTESMSSSTTRLHIPQAVEITTSPPPLSTVATTAVPTMATSTMTLGRDELSPEQIENAVTEGRDVINASSIHPGLPSQDPAQAPKETVAGGDILDVSSSKIMGAP